MSDDDKKAKEASKAANKMIKTLESLDPVIAFSALNFCFTAYLLKTLENPVSCKAAIMTFAANTNTSVDAFFGDEYEEEYVH